MKDSNIFLTSEEKEIIYSGLCMRKNFIETGDCLFSAIDAKNMGEEKCIKILNTDQIKFVIKIQELIKRFFN